MKRFWLLLVGLALAVPVRADKKSHVVEVQTFPAGVQIFRYHPENSSADQDDFLGLSNQPLYLSLDDREMRDEWLLYFAPAGAARVRRQQADLYHVRLSELVAGPTYPHQGVLRVNLTWDQWVRYYGVAGLRLWWLWLPLGYLALRWSRHRKQVLQAATRAVQVERRRSELTAHAVAGDPMLGRLVGDYQILKRVGEGGMGIVYRAVPKDDPDEAKAVAIKMIRGVDQEFRDRFMREARIYGRLQHPNIMVVHEVGLAEVRDVPDGWPFMVMELIQGHSLRDILRNHPDGLALRHASSVLSQILRAVQYAHGIGVVHRDLKPENIMVSSDKMADGQQRVVVMDFGLARAHDLDTVTQHGEVLGTPVYMAPEQMRGDWSPFTDQYALGVLAFEILTGKLPFDGETTAQIIMQHLHDEPRKLRDLRPNLPDNLDRVVGRMLAKAPEERFPDLSAPLAAFQSMAPKGMRS